MGGRQGYIERFVMHPMKSYANLLEPMADCNIRYLGWDGFCFGRHRALCTLEDFIELWFLDG